MNVTERAFAPHCDSSVLHAPGKCEYCAKYSDWQEYRITSRINFTGENDPNKAPCPSVYLRKGSDPNLWEGNRPEGYQWANELQKSHKQAVLEFVHSVLR